TLFGRLLLQFLVLAGGGAATTAAEKHPVRKPAAIDAPREQSALPAVHKKSCATKKTPAGQEAQQDDEEMQEAGGPAEDGLPAVEGYAPAVAWLQTARFVEYVQYTSSIRAMLTSDWQEPKGGLHHGQAHFELARKLHRDDPRLPFAYGLLLWKHQQADA